MRIVAFAYACGPGEGSEPGAGWVWARLLSELADVTVITRTNNRAAIERAMVALPPHADLHFAYVDLPSWMRRWKRGQRGVRAYYLLWQLAALRRARRLHRSSAFDLSWHLTFANAWFGAVAPLLGPPTVYGPVGAGARTSWRLVPLLGARGVGREVVHAVARATARLLNPLARVAWRRSVLILTQNEDTRRWLPGRHRHKAQVFPNVVLLDEPPAPPAPAPAAGAPAGSRPPVALFAGRLLPHKGVALAIRAVASRPDWVLLICGDGPDRARLEGLARRLGVSGRVSFLGHTARPRLLELMADEADVFLFPTLHDEAGWVVAEAASRGLPVVCLDKGGPAALGGIGVAAGWPATTVRRLAEAMDEAVAAPRCASDAFGFRRRRDDLQALLEEAGVLPRPAPGDHP